MTQVGEGHETAADADGPVMTFGAPTVGEVLAERYQLEVSSPGIPRPLIRPKHFQRSVGSQIAVETREAIDGRKRFTGSLRDADDERIVLELPDREEPLPIPLSLVRKSHLVEES